MATEEPEIYIAILKASYDYEPQSDDEISIKEDQLLLLIEKVDDELVISFLVYCSLVQFFKMVEGKNQSGFPRYT